MTGVLKVAASLAIGTAGIDSRVAAGDVVVRMDAGEAGAGNVVVMGRVDATWPRVWDVLTNQEDYPRIFREIRRMSYVREGIRGPVWRADVTLPWPLGDQWTEDEVVISRRGRTVNWYHVGGTIRDNTGSWRLQPAADGATVVIYRNRFDPGVAWVPRWLMSWAVSHGIPKIVRDLRAFVERKS